MQTQVSLTLEFTLVTTIYLALIKFTLGGLCLPLSERNWGAISWPLDRAPKEGKGVPWGS